MINYDELAPEKPKKRPHGTGTLTCYPKLTKPWWAAAPRPVKAFLTKEEAEEWLEGFINKDAPVATTADLVPQIAAQNRTIDRLNARVEALLHVIETLTQKENPE